MKIVHILMVIVVIAVLILVLQGQVERALLVFIMSVSLLTCANTVAIGSLVEPLDEAIAHLIMVLSSKSEDDPHDISEEDEEEIRQVMADADVLRFHNRELQQHKTCSHCKGDLVPIIKPGSPDPWVWDEESRFAPYEYDYDCHPPTPHKEAVFICKKCSFVQQRSLEHFAVKTEEVPLSEATS